MLTKVQQKYYDQFVDAIKENKVLLFSSHQRAWGKSYILNELGLELQALGYEVYLLTQFHNSQEHIATNIFPENIEGVRHKNKDKMVVIVDEYRHCKMTKILEYCEYFKIPIVGYVDYN